MVTDFNNAGVGGHTVNHLDDLAKFRSELGLPKAGSPMDKSTIARLDIDGNSYYGINGHGQKVSLKANAQTATHAEGDVFNQAFNSGVRADTARLVVDRGFCKACGLNGGVKSMARQLGIKELEIIVPGQAPFKINPFDTINPFRNQ